MPFGVMMMTPADLEDFAVGFSLTEGVITTASDIRGVAAAALGEGIALADRPRGGPACMPTSPRRRALAGRTSCGLCGITDMDQLPRATLPVGAAPRVGLRAIGAALAALDDHQPLNAATRAVHGAAWCDTQGAILAVREDVGRHNALDKLIGARLRRGSGSRGRLRADHQPRFLRDDREGGDVRRADAGGDLGAHLARARPRAGTRRDAGPVSPGATRVTVFHGAERIVLD